MHPFIKRFIWVLIFAVLLYTLLFVWSDVRANMAVLRGFPWRMMPLILGAVAVNFVLREVKWDYYRRAAGIQVPRLGSFLVFFSGFAMAISPARAGELIKPFMYKEYFDQKMRRSIPLVFCERISDLLGMIVLGAIALPAYTLGVKITSQSAGHASPHGQLTVNMIYGFLILSGAFMAVMIGFARQKRWVYSVLITLSRQQFFGSRAERHPDCVSSQLLAKVERVFTSAMRKLRKLYHRTYPLLTARNLLTTTAMATFSWFFECIAMTWILQGVGATHVTLMQTAFIFCMATIFGGFLFFLPGGLGGFEASTLAMLALLGVKEGLAVPGIFITRLSTLFYAVTLGFLFILFTSLKYHKQIAWEGLEHLDETADKALAHVEQDQAEEILTR